MTFGSAGAGTYWTARGLATVPLAAALLAVQPAPVWDDPGSPFWDEIVSGSAGPEVDAGFVDVPSGSALELGSGSALSGSSAGDGPGASTGSSLGLGPSEKAGLGLNTGSTAGAVETAAAEPVSPAEPIAAPSTLGETLGFENGSVLTACAGSGVIGSSVMMLGLATGSGFGSGLLGPGFVPGSSGLVAPGSAGAGSVVLGSAVTGSALLTCLLLLPVSPPEVFTPLEIPAAPQPAAAPAPAPPPPAPPEPEIVPPAPIIPAPYEPPLALEPVEESGDWTALQMMTVLLITIIAAARAKVVRGR
ncbi:hypothetical protein [Nocardia crassostreae]|uniref:hypothetical protein n=1 Tax=Nocardia crassostreae TaxID=53428 RepID=UPI000832A15A|nr:hypothetical protein [Nocardia crassostreae]